MANKIMIDEKYLLNQNLSNRLNTIFGIARIRDDGYFYISSKKQGNNRKLLHRLIFEEFYQIKLPSHIVIHHDDGNKLNNKIWNLIPMTRREHADIHNYSIGVSDETCRKISKKNKGLRKGHKLLLEHKINMSKSQNSTGYFRVSKSRCKRCKQGFMWRYSYTGADGKQKQIRSVDLNKLKEKVIAAGLEWKQFDDNYSGIIYDKVCSIIGKYFDSSNPSKIKECAKEIYNLME